MNENDVIQHVEAYLHDRARTVAAWRELHAAIPAIRQQLERAAYQTALALECGVLSVKAIARIRSALAFADASDAANTTQKENPHED